MSKARTLANLISDNAELADGQISVAEVVGAAPTANPTFTGNIDAGDNVKIRLGDSDDLQLYHDGTSGNTFIDEGGSGSLFIRDNDNIALKKQSDNANMLVARAGAEVELYHNGSEKLATTSTGIQVTGNIANATGDLTLDVAGDIILDSGGFDVKLKVDGTEYAKFSNYQNNFYLEPIAQDKDLIIRGNDGGSVITALTLDMSEAGAATFNGAVNIPGFIKHVGDDNTFFGFPSGDEFRIETGGAERISINGSATTFNEDSADKDFRVESDNNANMLFVDGGANKVGIGTNSLGRVFNVYDPTTDGAIKLETGGNASNIWAGIEFKTPTSQSFLYVPSNDSTGLMKFLPAASEVLALSNSAVVVNEQSSDVDFRVESNNNTHMLFVDASLDHVLFGTSNGDIGGSVDGFRINAEGNALSGISETGTFTYNYYGDRRGSNNEGIVYGLAMNGFFKSSISVLGQSNSSDNGGITLDTISGNNTKTERMRITPTEAVFNEVSTDTDFRVETDSNSDMFVVDASANCVNIGAIGSSSTNYSLFVKGNNPESGTNTYYVQKISTAGYADTGAYTSLIGLGVEPNAAWSKGAIGWTRTGSYDKGHMVFLNNSGTNTTTATLSDERMRITTTGVQVSGSLSKSSGSFRIPHPVASKTETHDLVHSFVEAPQADNIYRGKVDLVAGQASVNIDTVAGMTEGTFAALNREIQCFTSNETGWTAVRGSVSGNTLTIEAQDGTCTDTISWLVVGERQDQHMYDTEWTDENGKVIVEPLKPVE